MRLLVVRHGQAVPQGTGGFSEGERPLTPEGERRFRAAALFIARVVPSPTVLLTSPLVRARQTAALLAAAWPEVEPVSESILAIGGVDAIVTMLERYPRSATVGLVGHEPTVSALVGELLGVISSEAINFEPGAAALLDVSSLARASARLLWYLPPSVAQ